MKTTSDSHHPGIVCRVVQAWSGLRDDAQPPASGAAGRHVDGCACCREYFRRCAELELALRQEARRTTLERPVTVDAHYLRTVRAGTPAAPGQRPVPWTLLGLAGAAAAVALVAFLQLRPPAEPAGEFVLPPIAAGDATDVPELADALWNGLRPSAGAWLDGEPLQNEVAAVYADARSALDFLAMNFLPGAGSAADLRGNPSASATDRTQG